ncbi:MAG: type I pullulanase [Lachnospiraceae bacterium]|nr:type I pullulanase [Lachnospiraceae bacterium]
MKRRLKAWLMAVVMLVLTVVPTMGTAIPVKAADDLIIQLHYHRDDGNYDGWSVWMWEEGGDGADYELADVDGEKVASMVVTPGTSSVGFIVRTADWAKDVDADQFIDISEMVSGTVDIYVESGVEGYTKEYGENAVTGTKLTKARYDGDKTITVDMTGEIEGSLDSVFRVVPAALTDSSAVTVAEVKAGDNFSYEVTLAEPLNEMKKYKVLYDGNEYNLIMPDFYSTDEFEAAYTYDGDDLGAVWSADKTTFRVWAPTADAVKVNLYASGTEGTDDLLEQLEMNADEKGTWVAEKTGDLNGTYYTYEVSVNGETHEACDPYARATGVNGKRAMVIDLTGTNPDGWTDDSDPNADLSINDAVIYELHVRDLSIDESSGIRNAGKYLGLTETGTTNSAGEATGLDHIKDLGITHLHLLPVYDYGSVDETKLDLRQFNWGYDPVNYNVPEGSYSTDPYNGDVRISEMKQMIQTLHQNDISVVMDVVYNHVYNASEFCFNQIVPDYFSRVDEEGNYSNGSGCGNDTATERAMVKKYIVDSVKYWADEYHMDGFRFDLVGLIDTDTVNEIVEEVHKDHPNVIFYGEGWTMDTKLTKTGYTLATQVNSEETPGFAFFNDNIRDGLKGNVFNSKEQGFVSGADGLEDTITKSFLGAADWCKSPKQTINYASCHDNMTLYDRIVNSTPDASEADQVKMNNLAAAVYLTAEGVPFMQAGEEFLRSKVKGDGTFDENSYSSTDFVNSLKWDDLDDETHAKVFDYYKGLIAFRKAHAALRLSDAADVAANVKPVEDLGDKLVAFEVNGGINGETSDGIYLVFNANQEEKEVTLPDGNWDVCINGEQAGTEPIETITDGRLTVAPISAMVLVKNDGTQVTGTETAKTPQQTTDNDRSGILPGCIATVLLLLMMAVCIVREHKKM